MSDLMKTTESAEKHSKEGRQNVSVKQKKPSLIDGGNRSRGKYPRKIPGMKEPKKQKKS